MSYKHKKSHQHQSDLDHQESQRLMQQRSRRYGQKQQGHSMIDTSVTELNDGSNQQQKPRLRSNSVSIQNHKDKMKKRTRKLSLQAEVPKMSKQLHNSISCDDIPLSMSASPEPYKSPVRNKNIVLLYDEDDKTSKEISQPSNLGVALPILAKYELTIETLQKQEGQDGNVGRGEPSSDHDKQCATITPRLLQEHDDNQNEVQNKGLHVIKWLSDLEENSIDD